MSGQGKEMLPEFWTGKPFFPGGCSLWMACRDMLAGQGFFKMIVQQLLFSYRICSVRNIGMQGAPGEYGVAGIKWHDV